MDSSRPDGLSKSPTSRNQEPSTCQACDEADFEELPEASHPVCTNCGFIANDSLPVPEHTDNGGQTVDSDSTSWKTFSSVTNSTEKQVVEAIDIIESLGDYLDLEPQTRHHSAEVYTAAAVDNLTDGRPTATVVAAAVSIGTRERECPRPVERVAETLGTEASRIQQTVRLFQQELDRGCTALSPTSYIPYICKEIGLETHVQTEASSLAERVETEGQSIGKNPAGVAGAAVYLTSTADITQREVAEIAGVTKETIRLRVKETREVMSDGS